MGRSSKDKRDIYYRKAKEGGWRARSAFKLLQIDEQFEIFDNVTKVVDLCAAPGSWSQVIGSKLRGKENSKVVAVDLQAMAPIPGVIQVQGDITKESTIKEIFSHFDNEKVELVVFDGAPDVTGLHDLDEHLQGLLLIGALNITTFLLKPGGTFVGKIFRSRNVVCLETKFQIFFENVSISKPKSSRNSSIESFIVCQNYSPPADYVPMIMNPFTEVTGTEWTGYVSNLSDAHKKVIPFVLCGDVNAPCSDTSYCLDSMEFKSVVQGPISPPYQESMKLNINQGRIFVKKHTESEEVAIL
uniref:Putative tRNA (cytidine(32)/guanosine(34)-2'-O)-methyltransferase n=1 Tax=Cacopsylla melanoneura TaxID=428564 RepID=A0A8D8YRZ3_9HEMI